MRPPEEYATHPARLGGDVPPDRSGLCVCGQPVAVHFTRRNRFIACDVLAAQLATVRFWASLEAGRPSRSTGAPRG